MKVNRTLLIFMCLDEQVHGKLVKQQNLRAEKWEMIWCACEDGKQESDSYLLGARGIDSRFLS